MTDTAHPAPPSAVRPDPLGATDRLPDTLCPVEPDTPVNALAKAFATILSIEGVDPCSALPLACHLFGILDRARKVGVKAAIELEIECERVDVKRSLRFGQNISAKHHARIADSLEMLLGEL